MTNILNLKELLTYDTNLSISKKAVTNNVALSFVGIMIAIIGTQINVPETFNYLLGVGGFIIALIGIGNILSSNYQLITNNTKESLTKHKLYFHKTDENLVLELLKSGDLKTLSQKSISTGPLQVIVYSTSSHDYFIAQLFLFTPYEFSPYSSPITYSTHKM